MEKLLEGERIIYTAAERANKIEEGTSAPCAA